jgi:hypothetical protein
MRRAMRLASPVFWIAAPMTKPLSTSQRADEAKPEKITPAGASARIAAPAKNSRPVRYSGSRRVAHSAIVAATTAGTRLSGLIVIFRVSCYTSD